MRAAQEQKVEGLRMKREKDQKINKQENLAQTKEHTYMHSYIQQI